MELIANILLIAGVFAAAFYCRALAGRVRKLKELDNGLGAAIAALSRQVDEMRTALAVTKEFSSSAVANLGESTARAEIAAGRLELLLAKVVENKSQVSAERPMAPLPVPENYVVPLQLRSQDRLRLAEKNYATTKPIIPELHSNSPLGTGELVSALRRALFGEEPTASLK